MSRRSGCRKAAALGAGALALGSHGTAYASTAAVGAASALFVATTVMTVAADAAGVPPVLLWIWAALAGTMAGAFAAVMASLIVSPRARLSRHLLHLGLAFVAGLIGAPLAAWAWDPKPPEHIPLAIIWFAISGVSGFVAPAFAIVLLRRSESIAGDVIDRVTTPEQARAARGEETQ